MTAPQIRHVTNADLPRINDIYNSYIIDRHTSFDLEPWTLEERTRWFAKYGREGRYQALVILVDDLIAGFASSSPFRDKVAYETSVETTIVLDEAYTGRGLGAPLLEALLERLQGRGIHRAYALIALPNEPSITLHRRCGYREVGILDEVGHKLDAYHSVLIMELRL
jgi:phosphinothricin acetyltransferase